MTPPSLLPSFAVPSFFLFLFLSCSLLELLGGDQDGRLGGGGGDVIGFGPKRLPSPDWLPMVSSNQSEAVVRSRLGVIPSCVVRYFSAPSSFLQSNWFLLASFQPIRSRIFIVSGFYRVLPSFFLPGGTISGTGSPYRTSRLKIPPSLLSFYYRVFWILFESGLLIGCTRFLQRRQSWWRLFWLVNYF